MDSFHNAPPTAALATIDAGTQQLADRTPNILSIAEGFDCVDRDAFVAGSERLREIKDLQKRLEERRTSVTGPLNTALRNINDWFRGPVAALVKAEQAYKYKLAAFQDKERKEVDRQKREAEEKARQDREELERRARAAAAKGNTAKAEELVARADAVVPAPPELAPIKAAGVSFSEQWEFEVVDASLIPRAMMTIDLAKIGQLVRALKNKETAEAAVPGIKVFSRPKVGARALR
jgi:hypothetical protein